MKADERRIIAVERAVRRYALTLRQGRSPCRADGNPADQTGNYRDAIERVELRYSQIRELLMLAGVPTVQFAFYRSFGLHVDKLCRDHSAQTLQSGIDAAIVRWRAYGCEPHVLRAICEHVFGLTTD